MVTHMPIIGNFLLIITKTFSHRIKWKETYLHYLVISEQEQVNLTLSPMSVLPKGTSEQNQQGVEPGN